MAEQLTKHGALEAHARDEIGIVEQSMAKPIQAAFSSALTFTVGAALPLLAVFVSPHSKIIPVVAGLSLIFLAVLGGVAARVGGAPAISGVIRVTFWGALAMAITAAVGRLFGVVAL